MSNPLFGKANGKGQQQPVNRRTVLDQLQNFASQINGDPRQMVQQIVQERGVSQDDLNRVVQGAQAFMQQFGLK